jgi:phage tail sheath gpL-like
MTISFAQIPVTIRTPGQYVEFDNSLANKGLVRDMTRVLLLGQLLPGGTATPLDPVRVLSADHAVALFGRGSMLAAMAAAFKKANEDSDLWVVPVADNAAGQAATGTVTIAGSAVAAGTLLLYVGGTKVQAAVAVGASAATVAADLADAVNALPDLPVTAAAEAAVVTLTSRHKGECMNSLDLRTTYWQGDTVPAGLTVTLAAMSGGSGNPDVNSAIAVLGDVQYHHVIMPWTDAANLAALEAEVEDRWSATRQIEGQIWAALAGSHSALSTVGSARNSEVISLMGAQGSPTPPWVWAAAYGAVAAYQLGIDPARPLQTLVLPGVLAPKEKDRFTRAERNLLLYDGISTFLVAVDGTVSIERAITTYQVNAYGLPDPSYLDVETLATLSVLRSTLRARISQKFPRHKLADDGTRFGIGQAIVTPGIIRAELIALARAWEERGWVEQVDAFKDQLIVERNADDPTRVDVVLPPDLVNQLRVFAALVQFRV